MKTRKLLILLIGVFAIVAMLVSCTAHKRPGFTLPSTQAPQIATTMVEVTGHPDEKGIRGKLKINFDPGTGECTSIEVNGIKAGCRDPRFVIPLEKFYICITSSEKEHYDKHPSNTAIYGKIRAYCGNVKFLTDGADFRFKEDSTAGNKECHNSGGYPVCW